MKKIIFIVGPTAVGKTSYSIKLAKDIQGEIISADSMQAYRDMDIISQKPTPKERKEVPHHLIDIIDIRDEYSAAEFVERATPAIETIIERKKIPIVVGGSGLYIKALIDGLFPSPPKDIHFRTALQLEANDKGVKSLHDRLAALDPEAASKIHPNDLRRTIRALEVYHLTGRPISSHKENTKGIKERFNIVMYGLLRERNTLYKRIEDRVEDMFKQGIAKEVKRMIKMRPSMTASSALGYKEVSGYLDKRYSLEEAKELLKKNTRRYAKRQLTWFRADKRIEWIRL